MEQFDKRQLMKHMTNVGEFNTTLTDISKTWDQLILFSQLGATGIDMHETKENFNALTNELMINLSNETIKKVINEMRSKAQVTVDIVIRNLFERTADIGFLATDDDIRQMLINLPAIKRKLMDTKDDEDNTEFRIAKKAYNDYMNNMQTRFEEYVAKYSVYYDIVLFDTKGRVVTQLDKTNGIQQTHDTIISLAQTTNEEYVETYKYHDFLPQHDKSLVYTYKITTSNTDKKIIGFLSLCFKFENELEGVFKHLINKQNKEVILLLDHNHEVIATSDKYHIPLEAKLDVELDGDFGITQFAGRDYIIKTCKTNGYEGFYGLGWLGHIMIPLESAFNINPTEIKLNKDILDAIMKNDTIFGKELLEIPKKAEDIQGELNRAVWNGNIAQQTDNKSTNIDFARSILREVRLTGEKTQHIFNSSIEKLNQTIISSLLDNAQFLASLSIDIMDRNLYERANDCRWWALNTTFKTILTSNEIRQNQQELTQILQYINGLYTVYTNLFIYDTNGRIVAVSNPEYNGLLDSQLTQLWIKQTLNLVDSSKYAVSQFEKTFLYNNKHTYIYNAAIKSTKNNHSVGGIGIIFDGTDQFQSMLQDALPKTNGKINNGVFSVFVEKNSKLIISCSNDSHKVGDIFNIEHDFFDLKNGESMSKIINYRDKYYIVGTKCSQGYREYKSHSDDYINDILSFVFIEAGDVPSQSTCQVIYKNDNNFTFHISPNTKIEEIATFYIDNRWLGVKVSDVIESISIKTLEDAISMDLNHHFKGTSSYKNYIVSVLDISPFIKNTLTTDEKHDIIILKYNDRYDENHTIGIIVDKLGEIIKVPVENIKPLESHLISGGMLVESVVQPPENSQVKGILTILNISKISTLRE